MDAHEAQKVALLRAVEETDTDGELLPLEQRHSATREAGGQVLDPPGEGGRLGVAHESFLAARAQELAPVLEGLKPGAGAAKWMGLAVAGVLLLCLAIGVLSDRLGGPWCDQYYRVSTAGVVGLERPHVCPHAGGGAFF